MKVIFLDIDGVLNSEDLARKRIANFRGWNDTTNQKFYDFIDENAVKLISDLCEQYNVKLVISSSWRLSTLEKTIDDFSSDYMLLLHPLVPFIIGITPRVESQIRGEEIAIYLQHNSDITDYCIIDDDSDMLKEQTSNFVQTSFWHGLTNEHIPKIKSILKL